MKIRTFFDLCSGIGGGRLGLEMAGLESVGYSDTSKLSVTTYNLMFDTKGEKNYGNLRRIKPENLPPFDLLIAGFPCQSFSVIGRQDGFADIRGQIIFHIARLLKETQPMCFILENVRGLVTHNKGQTIKTIVDLLRDSGYSVVYKVLNSLEYGVPQMRQRVYFIGIKKGLGVEAEDFNFPLPLEKPALDSYLTEHKEVSEETLEYLERYLVNKVNQGRYSMSDILNMEGKVIDTRMSDLRIYDGKVPTLRSQRDGIFYVKNHQLCALTGYEALLLQGFPKEYADRVKGVVSDRHLLMQAGNAMTTHVIRELCISLLKTSSMKKKTWKIFEEDCCAYLTKKYGDSPCSFEAHGGADSTSSDICVKKGGVMKFNIEVKMSGAQCGQFVLFPNMAKQRFDFSPRNKSPLSDSAKAIIAYMDEHFDLYSPLTRSGENLDIPRELMFDWVKQYYSECKGTRYFMTRYDDFVISDIDRIEHYFDISATYRIKQSGSAHPTAKNLKEIQSIADSWGLENKDLTLDNGNCYISIKNTEDIIKLHGSSYAYQFKREKGNLYEVKRLSNTANANVIFSVHAKNPQQPEDLKKFEEDLLN
ncbi:MAG: DNA (cytosine-5-)-methyltransferase [Bacteroidaceae bacterium]|nr:DNA (cytosine-5-)-methyltransferase [Bacteroidaceae bacterium]